MDKGKKGVYIYFGNTCQYICIHTKASSSMPRYVIDLKKLYIVSLEELSSYGGRCKDQLINQYGVIDNHI